MILFTSNDGWNGPRARERALIATFKISLVLSPVKKKQRNILIYKKKRKKIFLKNAMLVFGGALWKVKGKPNQSKMEVKFRRGKYLKVFEKMSDMI